MNDGFHQTTTEGFIGLSEMPVAQIRRMLFVIDSV
jgi:hypothetical protein